MTLHWHCVQSSHGPVNWLCGNLSDNCLPCWYLIDTSYNDETVTWQGMAAKGLNESLVSSHLLRVRSFSCLVFSGWGLAQLWSLWNGKRSIWLWYKSQKPIEILAGVASLATRSDCSPRPRPFTAVWLWAILGFVPTWHCLVPWQGSGSQAVFPLLCGTCQQSGRASWWANLSGPGTLRCKMIAWHSCFPPQRQGCGTFEWSDETEALLAGRRMKLSAVANTVWVKEGKLISSFGALTQCRTRKDFVLFGHSLI